MKNKISNIIDKYLLIIKESRSWYFPAISLIFVFILLVFFNYTLNRDLDEYSGNLDRFYTHPYSVRNAAHEILVDVFEVDLLWSGHSTNTYAKSELEQIVLKKFARIDSSYGVINEFYLGSNEDLRASGESLNNFKSYINGAGYDEDRIDHSDSSHAAMDLLIREINEKFKPIESFATDKANEFLDEGKFVENAIEITLDNLFTSAIIFILISSVFAAYLLVTKGYSMNAERKKFSKSIKSAPIPIMIHKNGEILELSDVWVSLTGYTIKDIPTIEEWSRKAYGEKNVPSKEFIMELYNLKHPQDDGVWHLKTNEGKNLIWQFHSGPLGDDTIISTAIDITEVSKQREQFDKLLKETQKLAKAVDQSPVSIVITNVEGKIEYVNKYFSEITGYSFVEAIGENPRILKSGLQEKSFYKNLWDTISAGKIWTGNMQNKTKEGEIYWESVSISPIIDDYGNISNYVAVKENITDRIRFEEALTLANNNLIKAQKIGRIGNWTVDFKSEKIEWSEQLFDIYDRDIKLGPPSLEEFHSYHLADEESFQELVKALEQGKPYDKDVTLISKQGEKKFIRTVGIPEFDSEGTLLRFSGVAQDITSDKIYELKLLENEQRLESITDNIDGLLLRYVLFEDGSNTIDYISKGVEDLQGITQKQVLNDSSILWNQIVKEDVDRVSKSLQESAKNLSTWDCKWRIKTPKQGLKWIHGKGNPRIDKENKCTIWNTIVVDITKQVNHENTLNETNIRLEAAQDIAKIGHWSVDVDSGKVYLSPIVREIHEMDHNVNVNEGVNYYKEGYNRERIAFVVNEAIEKGTSYQEELVIITEKGNERWVRTNGKPILKNGKCVQIIGTFIDITKEKEKEQQLKENLKEKEVLLGEVHHRVKNNLAIISGLLELQMMTSKQPELTSILNKSVNRIKSIALIHETLYKTNNFVDIPICDSIKIQVESLLWIYSDQSQEPVKLSFNLDNITLNINQAIPAGLLVNELVTNSLKYAFKGVPNPELKVSFSLVNENVEITIHDNGVGFNINEFNNNGDSLGHTLIETFVAQLEGSLDIQSSPQNGSKFTTTFKPNSKKGSSSSVNFEG